MIKKVNILLLLLLSCIGLANAQQVVQKVSRHSVNEYLGNIELLEIIGEKATIKLEGWEKNYIEVELLAVSRNTEKAKAIEEIKYIKTDAIKDDSKLLLKNYFNGESKKISSNLSVEYNIKIPKNSKLIISNLYGRVDLANLSSSVFVSVAFGSISIKNINGNMEIQNKYSNLSGDNISGSLICISEKSDINLSKISSAVNIESKYGEIKLQILDSNHPLEINSRRSSISITIPEQAFNYELNTSNSTITIPDKGSINAEQFISDNNKNATNLKIKTSYCPIIINHEKP